MIEKEEFIKKIVSAFEQVKDTIKKSKLVLTNVNKPKYKIYTIEEFQQFKKLEIYSIKFDANISQPHLSGVNILYYLVSIYMLLNGYKLHEERKENKLKILKKSSFIFEEDDEKIYFFSIEEIKNANPELFKFDLPKITD